MTRVRAHAAADEAASVHTTIPASPRAQPDEVFELPPGIDPRRFARLCSPNNSSSLDELIEIVEKWVGAGAPPVPPGLVAHVHMLRCHAALGFAGEGPSGGVYRFEGALPLTLGGQESRSREVCLEKMHGWDVHVTPTGVRLLVAWLVGLRVRWIKGRARVDPVCLLRTGTSEFFDSATLRDIFPRLYYDHPAPVEANTSILKPNFGSMACLMIWCVGCFNAYHDPTFRTSVFKRNYMLHCSHSVRSQTITVCGGFELKMIDGVAVGSRLKTSVGDGALDLRVAMGPFPSQLPTGVARPDVPDAALISAMQFKQNNCCPSLRPVFLAAHRAIRLGSSPDAPMRANAAAVVEKDMRRSQASAETKRAVRAILQSTKQVDGSKRARGGAAEMARALRREKKPRVVVEASQRFPERGMRGLCRSCVSAWRARWVKMLKSMPISEKDAFIQTCHNLLQDRESHKPPKIQGRRDVCDACQRHQPGHQPDQQTAPATRDGESSQAESIKRAPVPKCPNGVHTR